MPTEPMEIPEQEPASGTQEETLAVSRRELCHELLLRLAATAPGPLLVQARDWLAKGREREMARAVAFAAVHQRIALTYDDVALLAELLEEAGVNPVILAQAERSEYETFPPYLFEARRGERFPRDEDEPEVQDEMEADAAAIAWAERTEGVTGMWRAWRIPADGAPWPPSRRVYVAEMSADPAHDLPAAASALQNSLLGAGETEPSAEVYRLGRDVPLYQRLARGHGELIHTADDAAVRVAATFDDVDSTTGPRYRDDHPRVEDIDERARLVAYLRTAEPLMITTARLDDVVDRSRKAAVPMSFRTDGHWVWTEALAYYLAEYGLAPEDDLVAHIRAHDYVPPTPDGPRMHRALKELTEPSEPGTSIWTFDMLEEGPGEPDESAGADEPAAPGIIDLDLEGAIEVENAER
ncbi:hypothetical protein [Actinomadura sp. 6N118]|uniref:hypothetical protein n=1 Tax=Actinomadura sp. 6N118 TaxID=3375151 RepID=UPI0037903987